MQKKLFESIVWFTDIHMGMKNNSTAHNQDCKEFVEDMCRDAKARGITTCIFGGDYFHNRSAVNISTLDTGLQVLDLLNKTFERTYVIVGNHDMYYKNRRDITSVNLASAFENVHFINEITTIDDCTFIPFMVDEEYKQLPALKSKYVFGHLELPGYMLNKMTMMPDHGKETEDSFNGCETVFSGHFHKRQRKTLSSGTEIIYTGNCFPHNFSDAWDDDRGWMFLEHGGVPEFIKWDKAPKYRTMKMSDLLENPEYYLSDKVIAKVELDVKLNVDEMSFIRDMYTKMFNARDISIVSAKVTDVQGNMEVGADFGQASIDEIVIEQINAIDSNVYDKNLLISIYKSL